MEVQVLSRKLIKPSVSTPNHLRHLNISFLDHMAPATMAPLIFYYPADINVGTTDQDDKAKNLKNRCDHLEKSLSNVLTRFYPLAGRFIKEKLLVDCNDQGVEYIETQVLNAQLDEFLRGKPEPKMLNKFIPISNISGPESQTKSLVAIQVNIFRCTGLAIAISVFHSIADGFTGTKFITAWAATSRLGGLDQVIIQPCFDLPCIFPTTKFLSYLKPSPSPSSKSDKSVDDQLVTKTFVFDGTTLSTLKAKVCGGLSRLAVVSGLIWRALIGVAMEKHGHMRPSFLVHSINLRERTFFPIPENAMGNFYALVAAKFTPPIGIINDQTSNINVEWHDLAGLVRGALRNTVDEYREKARKEDDIVRMAMKSMEEVREESCKEDFVDVFMLASLCGFPLYQVDFGWGKPSWVSRYNLPLKMVSLLDSKSGDGGIEAWVSLNEQDMLQFQQHPDIVAFTSSCST